MPLKKRQMTRQLIQQPKQCVCERKRERETEQRQSQIQRRLPQLQHQWMERQVVNYIPIILSQVGVQKLRVLHPDSSSSLVSHSHFTQFSEFRSPRHQHQQPLDA